MIDVLVVFGTRPELIKLQPVTAALTARGLSVAVVATGQHTDLLDIQTLLKVGAVSSLGIQSDGSVLKFTMRAQRALRDVIQRTAPRIVLVQGDTMSAHAGALAAQACGAPLAHVEAGLRSGNDLDPWPEELIRKTITKIATWHFAPTMQAVTNISTERTRIGRQNCDILLTGNTSVDALLATGVTSRGEATPTVLVTLHRREFRDGPDAEATVQALADAVATAHVDALWPVHPAMVELVQRVTWPMNMRLTKPMRYDAMVRALSEARGVLTDSGGVVEEAATLGVPTAVLRYVTDRPEAEEAGIARRFPPTPAGVHAAWDTLAGCEISRIPTDVFGSGAAALGIANHLARALAR